MLRKLQKVDFSLIDLILYLDTNPQCERSKQMYRSLKEQREALMEQLSVKGMPVTAQSVAGCHDEWIRGPWPWEYAANA